MARTKGDFDFSANFEVKKKATLDARQYVNNYSELFEFTTDDYIPYGFPVACGGQDDPTKLGIWQCVNPNDLSNPLSWVRSNEPIPFNQVIQVGSFSLDAVSYLATLGEPTAWAFNENGVNYEVGETDVQMNAPDSTYTRADIIVWSSAAGYQLIEGIAAEDYQIPNTPVDTILVQTIIRNVDGSTEPIEPPDLSGYAKLNEINTFTKPQTIDVGSAGNVGMRIRGQMSAYGYRFYFRNKIPAPGVLSDFVIRTGIEDNEHLRFYQGTGNREDLTWAYTTGIFDFKKNPTFNGVNLIADADSDGKTYGRKDGEWVEVTVGEGTVTSVNGLSPDEEGNVEINADDIDDTSTTNKFVTQSEKNSWDGKADKTSTDNTEVYTLELGDGEVRTTDDNGGEVLIKGNAIGLSEAGAPKTFIRASTDVGEDEIDLELPHEDGKIARIEDFPIASDADLQTQTTPTEDNKIVSRRGLIYWWNWLRTQTATITARWQFTGIGIGTAGVTDALLILAASTASVASMVITWGLSYTGTRSGSIWGETTGFRLRMLRGTTPSDILFSDRNTLFEGDGIRVAEFAPDGSLIGTSPSIEAWVFDTDLQDDIVNATYDGTGRATVTGILAGQEYDDGTYSYKAYADNQVRRW